MNKPSIVELKKFRYSLDEKSLKEISILFTQYGEYFSNVRGDDFDVEIILEFEKLINEFYKRIVKGKIRRFEKLIDFVEDISSLLAAMSYEIQKYDLENFGRRIEFFKNIKVVGKELIHISRTLEYYEI